MAFDKEPVGYEKTVLSDLQGAWQNLRDTVVGACGLYRLGACIAAHRRRDELGIGQKPPIYEQMSAAGAQHSYTR